MVVGGGRCDLPGGEGQELSDEEHNLRYRPVVESFPKGSSRSSIFSLPFDELVSLIELDIATLLMMGKVRVGDKEDGPFDLVIVSFDGKSVQKLEAPLEGAAQLVLGPVVAIPATSEAVAPTRPSPLNGVWLLSESSLRVATGVGEPLWLPEKCQPSHAWFEGSHAWVVCENGLYTTDADQARIEIPESEGSSTCEALDPRPEYSVPGIYQKASTVGGCGKEFELGPLSKPSRLPDKLRVEF